jgi:hypothetical protein
MGCGPSVFISTTINPGCTVAFADGESWLKVGEGASILAEGIPNSEILFTTTRATSDRVEGPSYLLSTSLGEYGGIILDENLETVDETSVIEHCIIEWGQAGLWIDRELKNPIRHCQFLYNYTGIRLNNNDLEVDNCLFDGRRKWDYCIFLVYRRL